MRTPQTGLGAASGMACMLLLLSSACAQRPASCLRLPTGGSYCLQSTREVPPFEAQQHIAFSFQGKQERVVSQLEVDEEGMCMVALTPFGQKLLQVRFDNENIQADVWPTKRLQPAFLLGMVQLSTWPAHSIQQGLSAPYLLEEARGQRRLTKKGALLMKVDYPRGLPPKGDMLIEFPTLNLTLRVNSLEPLDSLETTDTDTTDATLPP